MSIIERVKRYLSRTPDGFIERPKANTAHKHTGKTRTARIGRHKRVQVGLVDPANVCPMCGSNPIRTLTNVVQPNNRSIYTCANGHSWADRV